MLVVDMFMIKLLIKSDGREAKRDATCIDRAGKQMLFKCTGKSVGMQSGGRTKKASVMQKK